MSAQDEAAKALLNLHVNPVPGNPNLAVVDMSDGVHQVGPEDAAAAMTDFTFPRPRKSQGKPGAVARSRPSSAMPASVVAAVAAASAMPPSAAMRVAPAMVNLQMGVRKPAPKQRTLQAITPEQLREICRENGLLTTGTKQNLSDRICLALGDAGANMIDEIGVKRMMNKGGKSQKRKARSHRRKSHRKSHKHGRRAH